MSATPATCPPLPAPPLALMKPSMPSPPFVANIDTDPPLIAPLAEMVPSRNMLSVVDTRPTLPPLPILDEALMSPCTCTAPTAAIRTCPAVPKSESAITRESPSIPNVVLDWMSICPPPFTPVALIMLPTESGSVGLAGVVSLLTISTPLPWISTEPPVSPAWPDTSMRPSVNGEPASEKIPGAPTITGPPMLVSSIRPLTLAMLCALSTPDA